MVNSIDSALMPNQRRQGRKEYVELDARNGEIMFDFEAGMSSCIVRTATGKSLLIAKEPSMMSPHYTRQGTD